MALLVLCVSLVLGAAPAHAAGSFTWNASIKVSVTSREWTQSAGTTKIKASAICPGGNYQKGYSITLQRKNWNGWESKGRKSYVCGGAQTSSWTGMERGTFRFYLSRPNDGATLNLSGSVTYP
ncbi:hypothetical protein GCM10022377_20810 [Zhihengliuella alba]|uniref:Ig-like domain-containing protein n=1 Tax=Zhihengliuella alba TaxID=547018 RepID=A0ABP7DLI6_9MICC